MPKDGTKTLYNLTFSTATVLASPYYFWRMWRRGQWRQGFAQRFGRYDSRVKQALTNRHVLWLHAVSVGEVNICLGLIRALEARLPNIKIVVSTTTTTGMELLRKKLPSHILKIYYPIDRAKFVSRAIAVIHPDAVVLVEAEIWPNFIWRLQTERIPLFLVNARLSERSFRNYKRFGGLFRPIFAAFAGVGAQNEQDGQRLRDLGCRPESIRVVGNMKFDASPLDERRHLDVGSLLGQLGVPAEAPILVAGSTHAGEEAILARVYKRLKNEFPGLFLVLVPRHFERGKEVGQTLEHESLRFVYRNSITPATRRTPGQTDCLLVNTTGELKLFYEIATLIFVGKSLSAQGGQNPIEAGALGKAMIFGPHMQNFQAIAEAFVRNDAALQVKDEDALLQGLRQLLQDQQRRIEMGRRALAVVRENQGALELTLQMILPHLKEDDIFVRQSS